MASFTSPRGDAFLAASIGGFIITLIIVILKILDVHEKLTLPWGKIEFVYDIVWAIFLLITSALVIDSGPGPYIAGGVSIIFIKLLNLVGNRF